MDNPQELGAEDANDRPQNISYAVFSDYTPRTTSGTSTQNVHTFAIPANTWFTDGGVLEAHFFGKFAANSNAKRPYVRFSTAAIDIFDGTTLLGGDFLDNNLPWHIAINISRNDSGINAQSIVTMYTQGRSPLMQYTDFESALDLIGDAQDLTFRARTPTAAGDITMLWAYGIYHPAKV